MSKINIYVNSKNRKSDESASNFGVIIPDGLLRVNKDEYFTMSVNAFYCYNEFINAIQIVMVLMYYLEPI